MRQEALSKVKVLVIGDAMLDQYWFGETYRLSPEAPVPIINVLKQEERLGGAANVALNVSSLGAQVSLLSVIGVDDNATKLRDIVIKNKINPLFIQNSRCSTIVKLRIIGRQQQMLRCDFESSPLNYDLNDSLTDIIKKNIQRFDVLVLSDYGKGVLNKAKDIIKISNDYNIPVFVDPKGNDYSRYEGATVITPNKAELKIIIGDWSSENDLSSKAQNLRKKLKLKYLLLTRSEEGMTLYSDKGQLSIPTVAREVFDVSGAGDTVISTLATLFAAGLPFIESVKISNQAAGIIVGKFGTSPILYSDIFQQ